MTSRPRKINHLGVITWDAGSDEEPPSPLPLLSQQLSLSPSHDLPGSSSQYENTITSSEQTAEGFSKQLDSIDNDEHDPDLAGSDEDVLRDSTDEIATAHPDTDADVEAEADADVYTVEGETTSEDDTDLFIVSSSVSSNPDLIVP